MGEVALLPAKYDEFLIKDYMLRIKLNNSFGIFMIESLKIATTDNTVFLSTKLSDMLATRTFRIMRLVEHDKSKVSRKQKLWYVCL